MKTRILTTALGIVATALPLQAQFVFNAAADFSTNQNPNGVWSYGWFPNTGTTFTLYPDVHVNRVAPVLQIWTTAGLEHEAASGVVLCNPSDTVVCDEWNCFKPHSTIFHPGSHGERGVFRWTAPAAGNADILAGFGLADGRAITDVHVWARGEQALFDGNVPGAGPGGSVEWHGSLAVAPGDTIDFFVGWGDIHRFCCQATYLDATITLQPSEPDQPPRIWTQPAGETNYVSTTVRLDVFAVGTWPFAYQWFKDEVEIGGATNSTLVLSNVTATASGDYTVLVSNDFGSVTSAVARVEVRDLDLSVLTNGLVAYYPLNGDAEDYSGLGSHGQAGGVTFVPDRFGQPGMAVATDEGHWVTIPSSGQLDQLESGNEITVSAWVLPRQTGYGLLICKHKPSTDAGWDIYAGGPDYPGLSFSTDDPRFDYGVSYPAMRSWTHIVLTGSRHSRRVHIYANGQRMGSQDAPDFRLPVTGGPLYLGYSPRESDEITPGQFDELRLYSRELSDTEVRMLYVYESTASPTNAARVIRILPGSRNVYVGDTTELQVAAWGTGTLHYQWFKEGMPIEGATNSTLVLSNVTVAAKGDYTLLVSNDFGSMTSEVARVTVKPRPSPLTLYVSADSANPAYPYDTWANAALNIQDAVDVAVAGDTVLVTNGVYAVGGKEVTLQYEWGNTSISGRVAVTNAIRLESINGPSVTTINGGFPRWCVYLRTKALLSGFTVTGGGGGFLSPPGGGVYCDMGAVVTNCVITGNWSSWSGAGVRGGTLYNCTISSNSTVGHNVNPPGGGAYRATLHGCRLIGNRAESSGMGEGGSGAYECTLFNCHLEDNEATRCTLHGCFLTACGGAQASTLYNCTLAHNRGPSDGTFYNCTVTDNLGGISGTAYNCILTGNAVGSDGSFYNCTVVGNRGGISGTAFNSILYYNSGGNYAEGTTLNYCCTTPLPTNGVGNLTGPPLFMDMTAGDFRLREDSPCIDAGTNLVGFPITKWSDEVGDWVVVGHLTDPTDILGNTRFIDGNGDGTVAWDIGAYEFNSFKPPRFGIAPQRTTEGWTLNITGPLHKWVSLERSGDLRNWEPIWSGFMWEETRQVATDDTGGPTFYRMMVP